MKKYRLHLIVFLLIIQFQTIYSQIFITENEGKDIYHPGWIDLNKNGTKDIYEDPRQKLSDRIENLLSQMTLEEKTCQMATLYGYHRVLKDELPNESWNKQVWKDGIANIDEHLNGLAYHDQAKTEYSWPPSKHSRAINEVQRFFIEDTRLGIPVDFSNEGIRGVCHHGATSFPAQIGIGSTWNKQLVREIGKITGKEARILGYTNIYSPILDLARDPRWGRTVECYSEDPFLSSSLGLEMVRALQKEKVISTAKHFAVYGSPKGGRDGTVRTDPHVTEREMIEIYLEPFRKAVLKGNGLGIMSSYNDYNGIPVSGSHYFLTEILRNSWGFNGYIVSDSWAVGGLEGRHFVAENFKESIFQSVEAGLNVRTNFSPPEDFILPLRELVKEGRLSIDLIDERVKDVLRVKFWLGLFDQPYVEAPEKADEIIHNPEHEKIALQASRESIVLLKNNSNVLPLDKNTIQSILVTGPNANSINHSISRYGPSNINVISVYDGINNLVGKEVEVNYSQGSAFFDENWPQNELYDIPASENEKRLISEAVEKARENDLVIAVVGDDEETVGESRSRTSLDLPGNQKKLIKALYESGTPVIVVLLNGRPLSINWIDDHIDAIIEAWFPGEFGGQAIAEVIFGEYNPGGKLPITFPRTVGQIPFNFPFRKSSQKGQNDNDIGKTRINTALYPFGHGLSYTNFSYSNLEISPKENKISFDSIKVAFRIKNTGDIAGEEVAQLYIRDDYSSIVSYEKLLRGFERIHLDPREEKTIKFILSPEDLSLLDKNMKKRVEAGSFSIYIASSSEDIRLESEIELHN